MSHDDDTCPHLVVLSRLEAENSILMREVYQQMEKNARLKAEVERSRDQYNGIIDTQLKVIEELKAEVERLSKPAIIGGYNLSEYIRMANSETLEFDNGDMFADMTLPERIKYIVESHARLKSEVERLKEDNRQLTKAFEIAEGIIKRMGKAAEDAAKEGKQP